MRYLVKCGVIRPVVRTNADTFFAFADLAVIKQANDDLAGNASFRAVARSLMASRLGQLAFDFRLDAAPAKILTLQRPVDRPPVRAARGRGASATRGAPRNISARDPRSMTGTSRSSSMLPPPTGKLWSAIRISWPR